MAEDSWSVKLVVTQIRALPASMAYHTLCDRSRFSCQSPQQADLPVVISLVKSQPGERGLDGARQRRTAKLLGHGKSQRLIGDRRQGGNQLLLRVGQHAAQRAQVKHLVAGMNWSGAAPVVCSRVASQNGSATGQGQDCPPCGDDVPHSPVNTVAGGLRDEQAFLVADTVQVAVERHIAEMGYLFDSSSPNMLWYCVWKTTPEA